MIAFREETPGFRACKAPVQQRPTVPNMAKMAEGGKGQRRFWVYIDLSGVKLSMRRIGSVIGLCRSAILVVVFFFVENFGLKMTNESYKMGDFNFNPVFNAVTKKFNTW